MARVKFSQEEIDQNCQIEDGIRQTLRGNPTAEVSASVIVSAYDLLDEKDGIISGTLEQKCTAIALFLSAEYSIVGENVIFRRQRPR